jgi:hypothetical protein
MEDQEKDTESQDPGPKDDPEEEKTHFGARLSDKDAGRETGDFNPGEQEKTEWP